jgi:hypothetical protein
MSAVTENDLKEIKDLISQLSNKIDERFDNLDEKVTQLRINQEKIQTRLDDWKPSIDKVMDLSEKVGELKNWRQFVFTALTILASGALGWYLRK